MKQSEILTEARIIIKDVYGGALLSKKKTVWQSAIKSAGGRVERLKSLRNSQIIANNIEATKTIISLWKWEAVLKILLQKYGSKFHGRNAIHKQNKISTK